VQAVDPMEGLADGDEIEAARRRSKILCTPDAPADVIYAATSGLASRRLDHLRLTIDRKNLLEPIRDRECHAPRSAGKIDRPRAVRR
jgi:hypothetical protein